MSSKVKVICKVGFNPKLPVGQKEISKELNLVPVQAAEIIQELLNKMNYTEQEAFYTKYTSVPPS